MENTEPLVTAGAPLPDYLDPLGLEFDPFGGFPASDAGFYFGAQRAQILEQVTHLSQFSASVLVVSGEHGCGRTTLKRQLIGQLTGHRPVCGIDAQVLSAPEQVFGRLASSFGCDISDNATAGEMLAAVRHRLRQGGVGSLLVLLDDAHLLEDAVLSALLSLLQSSVELDEIPLHIVMFGDVDLVGRLDGFAMLDVLLHDLILPSFSREELDEYLAVRLSAAGWNGGLPFDEAQLEALWVKSGAIPGAINRLASELLLERAHESQLLEGRGLGLPVAHMFSLVVLVGVLLMAFFYRSSWQNPDGSVGPAEVVESPFELPVSSGVKLAEEVAEAGLEFPLKGEPVLREALGVGGPEREGSVVEVVSDAENAPLGAPEVSAAPQVSLPAPSSAALKVVAEPELPIVSPANVVVVPKSAPATDVEAVAGIDLLSGERYVLALSPSGYVLQVMAAGSKEAVEGFIGLQKNKSDLHLVTTLRAGKPWFVVVTGAFNSSAEARSGVKRLPAEQKKAGPWPRSVSDVQAKIKEYHNI